MAMNNITSQEKTVIKEVLQSVYEAFVNRPRKGGALTSAVLSFTLYNDEIEILKDAIEKVSNIN